MGIIVFWTIIRTIIVVFFLWFLKDYIDYRFWWILSFTTIYVVIVHPISIHYRLFIENNKRVLENSLCTSCKYFDKSAVICLKWDQHPTDDYLPCEGLDWEPNSSEVTEWFYSPFFNMQDVTFFLLKYQSYN